MEEILIKIISELTEGAEVDYQKFTLAEMYDEDLILVEADDEDDDSDNTHERGPSFRATQGETFKDYFMRKLFLRFNAKSINDLNEEEKKRFFNEIQRGWDAKRTAFTEKIGKKQRRKQLNPSVKTMNDDEKLKEKLNEKNSRYFNSLNGLHEKRLKEDLHYRVSFQKLIKSKYDIDVTTTPLSEVTEIDNYEKIDILKKLR